MEEMVCIVCPNGCSLRAEHKDGQWKVTGNRCRRGEVFAITEMTDPQRSLCSTAATVFDDVPVIPVKVSREIPRERIYDVMEEINEILVETRVKRGDVLIENVLGLGADIIATSSVLAEQTESEECNE